MKDKRWEVRVPSFIQNSEKMKKIILLAICMMTAYSAKAYDFEHNGFYYNILSLADLTVELTCQGEEEDKYHNPIASYSGDITIPTTAEYAGKKFKVTQINEYAFINCSIGTLTIPETIERIHCDRNIGLVGTFSNLVIEDSEKPIKSGDALIGHGDVTNSVYLGRDIEEDFCSVVVGGSYKTITFGPKLTSVPSYCCANCRNLTEVNLPSNIKSIQDCAFASCTALTKVQGECVAELGSSAFAYCDSLSSFDFPSLRLIDSDCFADCKSLKDIVLPSGVVAVYGDEYGGAFTGCTSLESIVFPSTITNIGNPYYSYPYYSKIFVGCGSLKSISIANPTPIEFDENNLDMLSFLSTTLYVPVGAKKAYSEADGWKNFSNIVEDASITGDLYTIYEEEDSYYNSFIDIAFEDALDPYTLGNIEYRFAKKGTEVKINVKPTYGFKIESLYINGVDVASEIVSDTYSFTVTGSVAISVSFTFNPQPQEPIYLSIKQADHGCVKMKVSKWDSFCFDISPAEGWKIHSVSFNGQDMTDELDGTTFYTPEIYENSELVVAFEAGETEVSQIVASKAKVVASSGNIIVKDASPSENILVYDESGLLLANCNGNSAEQSFPVSKTGVYVVKVGNKTIKISL